MKRKLLSRVALLLGLSVLLLPVAVAPAQTRPATRPTTRPATAPAARLAQEVQRRITQLTRRSIELLEKQQFDEADTVLTQALALDPQHVINLYNLACVKALKGNADLALDFLEKAADAGYTDFVHLSIDPDLISLRNMPRYRDLIAKKLMYQRKAADRAVASLKEQFGDSYIYEINEQDRLIFATNVDKETLDALKKSLQAQARSQWEQLFEHKPDEFIRVVVPSATDYRKLVRMRNVGGVYNDSEKILVARQLGQIMTHEFTHALHAADRAPLEQEHPIWLVEGIASLFEAAVWKGDTLVPQDNFRLTFLQNAVKGDKLIPLDKLLKMEQREFVNKANLAYGQSSSVLLYLYEKKLLRPFYDLYKQEFNADPSGRSSLESVSGKTLPEFEKAWVAWMRQRVPPAINTGPNGVVIGALLAPVLTGANDGIRISSILDNGPAAKAGLKAGDVIVGLDGEPLFDTESFVPLISQHSPGDLVNLRVRRDGKYLAVPLVLGRRSDVTPATRPVVPSAASTQPAR